VVTGLASRWSVAAVLCCVTIMMSLLNCVSPHESHLLELQATPWAASPCRSMPHSRPLDHNCTPEDTVLQHSMHIRSLHTAQ
jgi:hypothetical protein